MSHSASSDAVVFFAVITLVVDVSCTAAVHWFRVGP